MEFKYNILLENVEQTGRYKIMMGITKKALNAQWQDVLMSGILNDLEKLTQRRYTRRAAQIKIKKAIQDEAIIPGGGKDLKHLRALKLEVSGMVSKNLTSLGSLFNYKKEMEDFLEFVGNKGGQQILDQVSDYTDTRPKIFRMSKEYARQKIRNRVKTLVKTLDKTGKDLLTKELIKGIDQGLTKKQVINNLLKKGVTTSEFRARRIVETETNAVYEYMRFETAKLNGIERKMWVTAGDDLVCFICRPNALEELPIRKAFGSGNVRPPAHITCYDKDTEIYTQNGWKLVKDVELDEKCLSLNPKTKEIEYVDVVKKVKYKTNELIHLHNNNFDLKVTPEHQIFYQTDWDARRNKNRFKFCRAGELPNWGRIYRSCEWQGKDKKILGYDPKIFARFLGRYLSEGSVTKRSENNYEIKIVQDSRKIDLVENDIKKLNIKYHKREGGIFIHNKELGKYVYKFGKCFEKFIPDEIKNSSITIIKNFLDTFCLGDGNIQTQIGKFKNIKTSIRKYTTSSKKLADGLGELILKIGKRPSYYLNKIKGKEFKHRNGVYKANHNTWLITECTKQYARLEKIKRDKIDYNDFVYCVELEKYHTLYVRSKGKCTWCGNCRCFLIYIIDEGVLGLDGLNPKVKKSISILDRLDNFLKASANPTEFYQNTDTSNVQKILNPNALWIGQDDLVGKDREVGLFAQDLKWNAKIQNLLFKLDELTVKFRDSYLSKYGMDLLDTPKKASEVSGVSLGKTDLLWVKARLKLTDIGFLQLLRSKGYDGKIEILEGREYPKYPKKSLNEIARNKAKDIVRDMENRKGEIHLEKYNLSFIDTKYKEEDLKLLNLGVEVDLDRVVLSIPVLKGSRVLNIMNNFNEAQRRGGEGIEVIKIHENLPEESYIVFRDGNHRVFAARQLLLKKIRVSKIWVLKNSKNT